MALHAVYALAGFCKDKLIDSVLADFTLEAMGVVRVVTSHDSLVEYGEVADIAVIRTVGANGRTIGQQEEVGIGSNLVTTFCALEARDVEE